MTCPPWWWKWKLSHHPTRWAQNTGLIALEFDSLLSPSHTVGSEPFCLSLDEFLVFRHHPTRWAQNYGLDVEKDTTQKSHHPTRWAQNAMKRQQHQQQQPVTIPHGGLRTMDRDRTCVYESKSPSHTVGSEPQTTTLNKVRHINNFVKGAPFSNEVNFPKSEIVQS